MSHRVLVVEDNDEVRQLLVDVLSRSGFEVLQAANGEEGTHRALSQQPDIVVLDLSLPTKSGWDVATEISQGSVGKIPIIALTGHASDTDRQKAFESGCSAYLSKPCRPRDLITQIERILEPNKGTGSR